MKHRLFVVSFLIYLCDKSVSTNVDPLPCEEICTIEKELPLIEDFAEVPITACPGHQIKLQLRPENSVDIELSVFDVGQNRKLFATKHFEKSEDVLLYSISNDLILKYYFPAPILSTPYPPTTTTTTTTTTPDNVAKCNEFCASMEDGKYPMDNVCCQEGGQYCDCYYHYGTIGQCGAGTGFCGTSGECIDISTCDASTCCPGKRYFIEEETPVRDIKIRYSCQPSVNEEETVVEGNGEVLRQLEQNTNLNYNLVSENQHNINVNLTLSSPIAGFAAVSIGGGIYALGYQNLNLSILNTETPTTEVKVITGNSPMSGDNMVLNYDLGYESSSTSTTPKTTTTTTASADKTIVVYVLAINETSFVQNFFTAMDSDFKKRTWKIMTEVCELEAASEKNLIHYNSAYSCRKSCFMTNDPSRGCAMMGMHLENIPESTPCPGIGGMSRIQYFREELEKQKKEMKTVYSASRVDIDSCTDITWTTEWVWVAVGLVVGVLCLAGAIMFIKKQGRYKRGHMDDMAPIMESEKKPITTSRSNKAFEIIDEE